MLNALCCRIHTMSDSALLLQQVLDTLFRLIERNKLLQILSGHIVSKKTARLIDTAHPKSFSVQDMKSITVYFESLYFPQMRHYRKKPA